MLAVNQTTSAQDLARALDGDRGTFLAQQGGRTFLVVAAEGHSIKSGPTPIGVRAKKKAKQGPQAWMITKISDADVTQGQYETQERRQRAGD